MHPVVEGRCNSQHASLESDNSSSLIQFGIFPSDSTHLPASGYHRPEKSDSVGKGVGGGGPASPPSHVLSGLFNRLLAASKRGVELDKCEERKDIYYEACEWVTVEDNIRTNSQIVHYIATNRK